MTSKRLAGRVIVGCVLMGFLLTLFGCAAMKQMRFSTQVILDKPPYYWKSFSKLETQGLTVGHLPVMVDNVTYRSETGADWRPLIDAMNDYLAAQEWTVAMDPIGLPRGKKPEFYIGNADMMGAPLNSETLRSEDADEDDPVFGMYKRDGAQAWKNALMAQAKEKGVDAIVFIQVGLSEYFVRQKNLLGGKELFVGTGYRIPVKWLTSLDDPVEVLHVTGILMDKTGKVYRVGAEGILAAKTAGFFESIIDLRNSLTGEAIRNVTTEQKRKDLTGEPLNYQIALQNLVANLSARKNLINK